MSVNLQAGHIIRLVPVILITWILVDLWVKVIQKIAYSTLNLDETSTLNVTLVAIVVTIIFFIYLYVVPSEIPDTVNDIYVADEIMIPV